MSNKSIAIIPARGGSKRIPKKNIIDFFGIPMIACTIKAALDSKMFDRVLVSTDDEEIAEVARKYGAEVPFLRATANDDFSHVSAATIAALEQAESYWNEKYDTVVQLMANCPLRNADDIRVSMNYFLEHDEAFQISCFEYGWMNPWWAAKLDENNQPERLFSEADSKRSQDLDKLYCPSGAIWIAQASKLKTSGSYYGPGHIYKALDWTSSVDIDEENDLEMAGAIQLMLKARSSE